MEQSKFNGLNWMGGLDGGLNIKQINIPGTHDCGTQYVSTNEKHFRCQNLSISDQLKIGVRFFDVRCWIKEKGKIPIIKHDKVNCLKSDGTLLTLEDVLESVRKFLNDNKTETVLLQIKNENGSDKQLVDYLAKKIKYNDFIWSKDEIPALREVRGKAVLIRRFTYSKNDYGITKKDFGINLSSWDTECHGWSKAKFNTYVDVDSNAYVQDRYSVGADSKYDLVIKAIEEANNPERPPINWWVINLTSCTDPTPFATADKINRRLKEEKLLRQGNKLGTFVMDFVDEALVRRVYETNE